MTKSATLRRVVQSTMLADDGATATDQELLHRFANAGDEAAFEALVRRHTGLVLGVCRRALSGNQDVEDACQAVFLILARKAKGGRWQPSIANWLYTTARRVSNDLRRSAQQRTRREGKAAVPESVPPIDRLTGRELLAVVDEELDRLSAIYREPLLLYFQQELTRDEIARRLGVPGGTVKIRLERGRKKLGDALTKRGIVLSTSLLALMATSPAGASPPRLADSIVAAALGTPRPAVAALAEGVAVNGIVKKFVILAALLAATAAVGFGPGGPTTAGQPDKAVPAKPAAKVEGPAGTPKAVVTGPISGTVVDPDGKPVAGADIIRFPHGEKPTIVGKTDAAGKFKVTVPLNEPWAYLFPRVPGYGPRDFIKPATNTPAENTFRLVKDLPIRGRVVDTQGKPVTGAKVVVRSMGFDDDNLDRFLTAWQKRDIGGPGGGASTRHGVHWTALGGAMAIDRTLPDGSSLYGAVTDKNGRFEIRNVGAEREVHLHVEGPGIANHEVAVITREGFDPGPYNQKTLEALKDQRAVYGRHYLFYSPAPEIVAESEKPVRGVVTDEAGKPVPGVKVKVRPMRMNQLKEWSATTDTDGKYELRGLKKLDGYRVSVGREANRGLLGRTVEVADTGGYEPVVVDVALVRGVVLTGTIKDGGTGRPVAGFACVGILFDNEFVKKPGFDSPDCYDFDYTKDDGVYRTVVPPGPVLLMIGSHGKGFKRDLKFEEVRTDPDYPQYFEKQLTGFRSPGASTTAIQGQYCKVLVLEPDQKEARFDVTLKRATEFRVRIEDAAGKPVAQALVSGTRRMEWHRPEAVEGNICTVYELDPGKPRLLVFLDPKTGQVAVATLKGDEKDPVVRLGPAAKVKGRLVDPDGKPYANVRVQLGYRERVADEIDRVGREIRASEGKPIETDANGNFEQDVVVPTMKFHVYGNRNGRYLRPAERKPETAFEAKAGETTDLGNVVLKSE